MNKLNIFTFALILYCGAVSAQPCLPNGITFNTQTQIDSFQINFPNCTEIEGDVLIEGNEITNLDSLDVLTSVYGNL